MISSVLPGLDELVAAGAFAVLVLATAAIVAALWLRRRWRRLRSLSAGHVRGLALDATTTGARWLSSRPLPDRRWRSLYGARRRMTRSLASAEHAVGVTRSAGAPLGDLESLCRRLRQAATDVDGALRIAQWATGDIIDVHAIVRQANDVTKSACRIQHAAALALSGTTETATIDLADDVQREVAAIAHGIATAGRTHAPLGSPRQVGAPGVAVASVWPNQHS